MTEKIDRRKLPKPGQRPPVQRSRAPWTVAILDYAYSKREESGEFIWMLTEELVTHGARFVPTGVAARRLYKRTGPVEIDDDEIVLRVERSRRWIANKNIRESKYLEHENGMTRYRLYKGEKHA